MRGWERSMVVHQCSHLPGETQYHGVVVVQRSNYVQVPRIGQRCEAVVVAENDLMEVTGVPASSGVPPNHSSHVGELVTRWTSEKRTRGGLSEFAHRRSRANFWELVLSRIPRQIERLEEMRKCEKDVADSDWWNWAMWRTVIG
ncbi:hypothetical protein Sjap_011894 [Stephania japonica]|uniref:Uncharacterized protein n=1 Tax=Stephania japonica TaxID=461633 RepID=A0AAP0P535_9MAGN